MKYPLFRRIKKILSQKVTLMFVFHGTQGPVKKHFSILFLVTVFVLWTVFTGVTVYLATKNFDYWSAKLRIAVLGTKYEFVNKELSKTWELLAKVEENDRVLRKLLNMKSKKDVILNSPEDIGKGGPFISQANFLVNIAKTPQEVNIMDYKQHFELIKNKVQQQIESYNEIINYIKLQKELYKYTPLIWPCFGRVVSPFGWRIHPIYGQEHFHTGIDIANEMGTPIRATANGIVKYAGWQEGYGKAVVIEHKFGYYTVYGHLSVIKVKIGQTVSRNEVIGLMGDTGTSTGPHLHYEVWRNDKICNPIKFVNPEDFFKG
ncbi:MAG: M23 family metallopeptidase [Elusimicrobiota bacterium]|nr:M23 family metallopeptidase [Elusimicrobiota bacterium]